MCQIEIGRQADESKYTLQKRIKDILKEDYDGLYNFFDSLQSGKFDPKPDFIVLTSRRCLVLFQIFQLLLEKDAGGMSSEAVILSDQAIPYYREALYGKQVVIVDDILIHGRAVSNNFRMLQGYSKTKDPKIQVYMKAADDIDRLHQDAKSALNVCCIAYRGDWRSLSNRIVSCIFASNLPYTSFVTAIFQQNKGSIFKTISSLDSVKVEGNSDLMQVEKGMQSFYCYKKYEDNEDNDLFKSLTLGKCIRVYYNKEISKYTIIPYVFLKSFEKSVAETVLEKISCLLPSYMKEIKELLVNREIPEADYDYFLAYKMRLLTCILSNYFWKSFASSYKDEIYTVDRETLDLGFGPSIAEELMCFFCKEDGTVFNKFKLENLSEISEIGNSELIKMLNQSCELNEKTGDIGVIKNYFRKAWSLDEQRAGASQERYLGLPLEAFLDHKKTSDNYHSVFKDLLNAWDTGIATANFVVTKESCKYVGCFVAPGEQGYKIILEKYPFIWISLIYLSKVIKTDYAGADVSLEEFREHRKLKVLELLKTFETFQTDKPTEHILNREDYEEIKAIIENEEGFLNAWNQVDVLRIYSEKNCWRDDKLVQDFITQKL